MSTSRWIFGRLARTLIIAIGLLSVTTHPAQPALGFIPNARRTSDAQVLNSGHRVYPAEINTTALTNLSGHFEILRPPRSILDVPNDKSVVTMEGASVYASSNSGRTWQYLGRPAFSGSHRSMAASPNFEQDQTLFFGTDSFGDAFRYSTDGGRSWQSPSSPPSGMVISIAVSPAYRNDRLVFVVNGYNPNYRISRSDDGGQIWRDVGPYPSNADVRQFIVSPNFASDQTLFLRLGDSSLWRSLNGGVSWSRVDDDLGLAQGNYIGHMDLVRLGNGSTALFVATLWALVVTFDAGESWYLVDWIHLGMIEVTDGLIIYGLAGQGGRLLRSTNLGDSWTEMLPGEYCYALVASRKHIIDGTVYANCASGLWATHNAGANWERRSSDINLFTEHEGSPRLELAPNFEQTRTAFAFNEIRLLRSLDGGQTWQNLGLPPANPAMTRLAVSPQFATDQTVFVARANQLYRSTTGGNQWLPVGQPFPFTLTLLRLSPNYPNDGTIFVGNYGAGIFISTNHGASWTNITSQLGGFVAVTDLEISPSFASDATIFINLYNDDIFRSADGGQSWTKLPIPQSPEYDIELSPAYGQDQTIFAANTGSSAGGIYRSTNRGNTWTKILDTYFLDSLSISPRFAQDQTLIVAQEYRSIVISEDAGESWMNIQGAPSVSGWDVAITYYNGILTPFAAGGTSIYKYRWPTLSRPSNPIFVRLTPGMTDPVTMPVSLVPDDTANLIWEASEQLPWLSLSSITGTATQPLLLTVDPQQVNVIASGEVTLKLNWSKRQSSTQSLPVLSFFVQSQLALPMISKSSPRYVAEFALTNSISTSHAAFLTTSFYEKWPTFQVPQR